MCWPRESDVEVGWWTLRGLQRHRQGPRRLRPRTSSSTWSRSCQSGSHALCVVDADWEADATGVLAALSCCRVASTHCSGRHSNCASLGPVQFQSFRRERWSWRACRASVLASGSGTLRAVGLAQCLSRALDVALYNCASVSCSQNFVSFTMPSERIFAAWASNHLWGDRPPPTVPEHNNPRTAAARPPSNPP